jgi:hypothetical protein
VIDGRRECLGGRERHTSSVLIPAASLGPGTRGQRTGFRIDVESHL